MKNESTDLRGDQDNPDSQYPAYKRLIAAGVLDTQLQAPVKKQVSRIIGAKSLKKIDPTRIQCVLPIKHVDIVDAEKDLVAIDLAEPPSLEELQSINVYEGPDVQKPTRTVSVLQGFFDRLTSFFTFGATQHKWLEPESKLKDKVLLAFKAEGQSVSGKPLASGGQPYYAMTFGDATMNVMVLGGTGSGKTASVIKPALHRLLMERCAGLVLDVKGDYAQLLRNNFPEQTHIVGMCDDAHPINLISGYNTDKLRSFLNELTADPGDSTGGGYFNQQGIADAILVFEFIQYVEERTPTLADIYDYLVQPNVFVEKIQSLMTTKPGLKVPPGFKTNFENRAHGACKFTVLHAGGYAAVNSVRIDEQYNWNIGRLVALLAPFSQDEKVRQLLCASDSLAIADLIYKKHKVIVLDMNVSRYGDAALVVSKLLRSRFRDSVINQGEHWLQGHGYGTSRFTFNLVDEYQEYLSTQSVGSANDVNWFDRSRSFGHINIVSTQSINSLYSKTNNRSAADTIVQNCRNLVCLGTTDQATLDYIGLISKNAATGRRLIHSALGEGFIYFGNSFLSGHRAVCGNIQTGKLPLFEHMNIYIGAMPIMSHSSDITKVSQSRSVVFADAQFSHQLRADELEYERQQGLAYVKRQREAKEPALFVISTASRNSKGLSDFKAILDRTSSNEYALIRMNAADGADALVEALYKLYTYDLRCHDFVVIVRGGGDVQHSSFAPFHSTAADELLASFKKEGPNVVMGIGHATDQFRVEQFAWHVSVTPTDAAYFIASVLRQRKLKADRTKQDAA